MSVIALAATADEYTDPQTNVIYTYEPGQPTASVKAGYNAGKGVRGKRASEDLHPGSPDAAGNIVILDRFTVGTDEYVVTSIGKCAFWVNGNIKSVSIPETVTDIEESAFALCDNLTSVELPNNLKQISYSLFYNCVQLDSVIIPSSVNTIGNFAFSGCETLTSLTLPDGLTYVGREAFNGTPWYAAQYNEAPNGPFYIGSLLLGYKGQEPVGGLVIREGTTYISNGAFQNCKGLTNVSIPGSVAFVDDDAFHGCTGLTSVTIADGVKRIGEYAFYGCSELNYINIPPSMAKIDRSAFFGCKKLNAVHLTNLTTWFGIDFFDSFANPLYNGAHLYVDGQEVIDLVIPEGVVSIGNYAFDNYTALTSVTIPDGVTSIGESAFCNCNSLSRISFPPTLRNIGNSSFWGCNSLTSVIIPEGVSSIGEAAFSECNELTNVTIPSSVSSIGHSAFYTCRALSSVISWIEKPFEIPDAVFELYNNETDRWYWYFTSATLYVPKGCKARYEATEGWKNFKEIVEMTAQEEYRPFVEDGKVWKFGILNSGNPMKVVDYYYFDGDTIIDGRTCKQMMCQRYVSSDYLHVELPSLSKVGAWFEENQKVYFYDEIKQSMKLKYDFTLEANDTLLINDYYPYEKYVIGPKLSGGIEGFKGVYRDIMFCAEEGQNIHSTFWLEGVGGVDGLRVNAYNPTMYEPALFLMSCAVGDEVIYLNDKYEDGATPDGARKGRFDFTHTIKSQPKAPRRSGETQSLSGEYNDLRLDINLTLLDEAYQVSITDETGKMVYKKAVNAGTVVALSIDISAYAKGRYTVTIENSNESFTGEFETQTSGINDAARMNDKGEMINDQLIYNLQGQRLGSLQRGLNIVNGLKIHVK